MSGKKGKVSCSFGVKGPCDETVLRPGLLATLLLFPLASGLLLNR